MTADDGLLGLGFLVGRWRGEGTLRGKPVTSRTECHVAAQGGSLSMRTETLRGGAVLHQEDLLWMPATGALVRCVVRPRSDEEQVWRVRAAGDGVWELSYPGHAWTIRRTADGYEESYGTVGAGGTVTPVVLLRHRRCEDPAP